MISIFISYSWKDREFVDKLDSGLQKYGYHVERDIRDAEYAKSIKEFMKKIRNTDYSIIVLSDNFLKSENCMREIFEFIKDDNFKDRIIPVVLESAKVIWGPDKGVKFTIFWEKKVEKFKKSLEQIDEESKGGYIRELNHMVSVKNNLSDIIDIFKNLKCFDANKNNLVNDIDRVIKKKSHMK